MKSVVDRTCTAVDQRHDSPGNSGGIDDSFAATERSSEDIRADTLPPLTSSQEDKMRTGLF